MAIKKIQTLFGGGVGRGAPESGSGLREVNQVGLSPLGEQHLPFYCFDSTTSGLASSLTTLDVIQRWWGPRESVWWGEGVRRKKKREVTHAELWTSPRRAPNSGPGRDLDQLHHCGSPAALVGRAEEGRD